MNSNHPPVIITGLFHETNDINPEDRLRVKKQFLDAFSYLPPEDRTKLFNDYDFFEEAYTGSFSRKPLPGQEKGERQMAHVKRLPYRALAIGIRPSLALIRKFLAHDIREEGLVRIEYLAERFGNDVALSCMVMTMPESGPGLDPPIAARYELWKQIDWGTPHEHLIGTLDVLDALDSCAALSRESKGRKKEVVEMHVVPKWLPSIGRVDPQAVKLLQPQVIEAYQHLCESLC
jgi:hypothetical protein